MLSALATFLTSINPNLILFRIKLMSIRKVLDRLILEEKELESWTAGLLSSKITAGNSIGRWISSHILTMNIRPTTSWYKALTSAWIDEVATYCCLVDLE